MFVQQSVALVAVFLFLSTVVWECDLIEKYWDYFERN